MHALDSKLTPERLAVFFLLISAIRLANLAERGINADIFKSIRFVL